MKCKCKGYGAYAVLNKQPNEAEEERIKGELASKFFTAIRDNLQVIRSHYPAGEYEEYECWTYGVKLFICGEHGSPEKSSWGTKYVEKGPTASIKERGFALPEIHYPEKVLLDLSTGKAVNGDGYEEDASRSSGK